MARRLPVYLLIDTSSSMRGEPIEAVNVGLKMLLSTLRKDAYALETVHLALLTFDSEIRTLVPLRSIVDVQLPTLTCPKTSATLLGEALQTVAQQVISEKQHHNPRHPPDWRPILFVLTDGKPTDLQEFERALPQIAACQFSAIVACGAGPKADSHYLQQFATTVTALDILDSKAFLAFFAWVTAKIQQDQKSQGFAPPTNTVPPPPAEIQLLPNEVTE